MKEITWRVRKGWVYLLGIFLILSFVGTSLIGDNINASEQPDIKNSNTQDVITIPDPNSSNDIVTEKTSNSSFTKADKTENKKKEAKAVKTPSEKQTESSVSGVQVDLPANPSETKIEAEDAVKMRIQGLGIYTIEIKKGDSAFDALKNTAQKYGFLISYTEYSWGVMITQIGATKAQGTYYWALYYNGDYSNVGASELPVKNKDSIEWRYESWM